MSDGIVEFIEAQMNVDEMTAHHSGPARVAWLTLLDGSGRLRYTTVASSSNDDDPWFAHGRQVPAPASVRIVYDPAQVLADVAAKREVIELYKAAEAAVEASAGTVLGGAAKVNLRAYGNVVRALAAAYSSRPGFKPEWRAL